MIIKMLKIQTVGLLLLSTGIQANSQMNCDSLRACEKKICNIKKELTIAKKMDNSSRIDGLETALKQVQDNCTDDKLAKDIEDKIDDVKKDLDEHTKDHEEAVKEKRTDKIEKYKAKITEDNQEIKGLEKNLKAL